MSLHSEQRSRIAKTSLLRVTAIAQGDGFLLTRLNAGMRTIDLLTDLISPVSACHRPMC